jgi:hypothetical protein
MPRVVIYTTVAVLLGLILVGGGYAAYWHLWAKFQPVTIIKGQAEIQKLLDESSWISADPKTGQALYMVAYRGCGTCDRFEREEFPKFHAAGVDPRIVVFARPDKEGLAQSTPAERATISEIWLTRDWSLYRRWKDTPARRWTAEGLPPADGSMARTAVVNASRDFVDQITPLLKTNGMRVSYPLLIWRDEEGYLKACACADSRGWKFVPGDLRAPERAPPAPKPAPAPVVEPAAPVDPAPAAEAPVSTSTTSGETATPAAASTAASTAAAPPAPAAKSQPPAQTPPPAKKAA